MDPATGGALISAGSAIASNFIANSGSKRSQKRANKYNVDFWNMQNEYNDPQAQMSRLKKAGLNPNLIYGTSPSSAVGNAQSIAPAKAEDYKFDNPMRDINTYAALKNTEQQTDNLKAQNTVLVQEAALKAAQTSELGIKTARSKFDLNLAEELKNYSLQAAEWNIRQTQQNTFGQELDNTIKNSTLKEHIQRIKYGVEHAAETLEGQRLQNQLNRYELQLNEIGITKNDNLFFRIFGRHMDKLKNITPKWANELHKNGN